MQFEVFAATVVRMDDPPSMPGLAAIAPLPEGEGGKGKNHYWGDFTSVG